MKKSKLVRDKIPDIIKASGRTPIIHTASSSEYREKLHKKLQEEVDEFAISNNASELADILEIVYSIATNMNLPIEKLEQLRREKAQKNGIFQNKIILDDIKE